MKVKELWGTIFIALLWSQSHCKSLFGIGMRITGDQLLLKDVLEARPAGIGERPMIGFEYAIPQPITYIEIQSEENVLAEVKFNYRQELVMGTITAILESKSVNADEMNLREANSSFAVRITIYGFSEEILNVNPSYILNKDQNFVGKLEPQSDHSSEDLGIYDEERTDKNDEDSTEVIQDDADNSDDFSNSDKILELGKRQFGDYLIYETYQTSLVSTKEPTNHSVIFYYIDSDYITYIRFVIFDHTMDKISSDYNPPGAEYSHFSPNTLKAVIIDNETTNLFVQMFIYGYRKADLPASYKPYIISSDNNQMESLASSLHRFKMALSPIAYESPLQKRGKNITENHKCDSENHVKYCVSRATDVSSIYLSMFFLLFTFTHFL